MKNLFFSLRKKKKYVEGLVIIVLIVTALIVVSFSDLLQTSLKYSDSYVSKNQNNNLSISFLRESEVENEEKTHSFFSQFNGQETSQYAYKLALTSGENALNLNTLSSLTNRPFFFDKYHDFSTFDYYIEKTPKSDFKNYSFIRELTCEEECRKIEVVEISTWKETVLSASSTIQNHYFEVIETNVLVEGVPVIKYNTKYLGFYKESKTNNLDNVLNKLKE